ncbi:MAG: hypothetical protein EA350_14945 [Gemmatimonadales bacterium]|nr:MAG: hypothetical protein EA350_14945 [Gemmatimonadales bacterium]
MTTTALILGSVALLHFAVPMPIAAQDGPDLSPEAIRGQVQITARVVPLVEAHRAQEVLLALKDALEARLLAGTADPVLPLRRVEGSLVAELEPGIGAGIGVTVTLAHLGS